MIRVRPANERGSTVLDWLDSRHTFSFNEYYDPNHMGFRQLRVINDDRVAAGGGFPTHGHRDMEILTWIVDGALQHRDSMGTGSVIRPGEIQRMSAGTGVMHSEFNHSKTEPVHLYQIWIRPAERGIQPGYEQKMFPPEERRGKLRLVASSNGRDGSVTIHQDAALYTAMLDTGESAAYPIAPGRHAWLQVARGSVDVNGTKLGEGDGAAVSAEDKLEIRAESPAEVLLFDLA